MIVEEHVFASRSLTAPTDPNTRRKAPTVRKLTPIHAPSSGAQFNSSQLTLELVPLALVVDLLRGSVGCGPERAA